MENLHRELKFRAWDNQNKQMGSVNWLCPRDNEVFKCRCWFGDGDVELIGIQFKIMQYTGLKDKNGKDIYERDIVRRCSSDIQRDENSIIYKVEWTHGGFYFQDIKNEMNRISCFDFNSEDFEVIGNIYENSDLIN